MSDNEVVVAECKFCGSEGPFGSPCGACPGEPGRTQEKQYSLSELRSMPSEERQAVTNKGRPSGAPPKIVQLPGSDPGR